MRVVVVTGSASGIGAAVRSRLAGDGCRVIGIDLRAADVTADLADPVGRARAIDAVGALAGGALDGVVACAGPRAAGARRARCWCPSTTSAPSRRSTGCGRCSRRARRRPRSRSRRTPRPSCRAVTARWSRPASPATRARRAASRRRWTARRSMRARSWRSPATCGATPRTPPGRARGFVSTRSRRARCGRRSSRKGSTIRSSARRSAASRSRSAASGAPSRSRRRSTFLLGPEGSFCCGSVLYADGGSDALIRRDSY